MSYDLFRELIPSLTATKEYIYDEQEAINYVPFVVNKALSYHKDIIFYVAELNKYSALDKKMHYDFYYYSLRKKKLPFVQWVKKKTDINNIELIQKFYSINQDKAKEYLEILTEEQIEEIQKLSTIGGTTK